MSVGKTYVIAYSGCIDKAVAYINTIFPASSRTILQPLPVHEKNLRPPVDQRGHSFFYLGLKVTKSLSSMKNLDFLTCWPFSVYKTFTEDELEALTLKEPEGHGSLVHQLDGLSDCTALTMESRNETLSETFLKKFEERMIGLLSQSTTGFNTQINDALKHQAEKLEGLEQVIEGMKVVVDTIVKKPAFQEPEYRSPKQDRSNNSPSASVEEVKLSAESKKKFVGNITLKDVSWMKRIEKGESFHQIKKLAETRHGPENVARFIRNLKPGPLKEHYQKLYPNEDVVDKLKAGEFNPNK
jgi:hypothetical protein